MATPEIAYGVPIISIVGAAFCVPYPVEFIIKKNCRGLVEAHFEVLDVNGNLFLQVGGPCENVQKKRMMRDPAGFPILTMCEKALTARHRWTVHRGESSDRSALLFSVQQSHVLHMNTRLDIFLAKNINEDISNFQVNDKFSLGKFCEGKDDFRANIYPGVDYAFMVALIIVLNENDIA